MRLLTTKFSKVLTITVITIAIVLFFISIDIIGIGGADNTIGNKHKLITGDTLNCTIVLDNRINTATPALKFATNLIRNFSEEHRCVVDIGVEKNNLLIWDKLIEDEIDVIVISSNDSIPAPYSDYVDKSIAIEKEYICAVKLGNDKVLESINYWITYSKQTHEYKKQLAWLVRNESRMRLSFPRTRYSISRYDSLVKKYSKTIGWDWRLFSALMYQESKFNQGVISRMGAIGLMQVMESTANRYGIEDIYDPEQNIKAGTRELGRLQNVYKKMGADSINVILLTLAAYNCGEGKIQHCMKVAKFEGKNHLSWEDLVSVIPIMNDGYTNGEVTIPPFKGKESITHVKNIIRQWELYKKSVVQ